MMQLLESQSCFENVKIMFSLVASQYQYEYFACVNITTVIPKLQQYYLSMSLMRYKLDFRLCNLSNKDMKDLFLIQGNILGPFRN
jgi:hypothetical protein